MQKILKFPAFFLFFALFAWNKPALAVALIRDAEIEETLHVYAMPIFKVAGLNPDAVSIHLVNDPALNAFVAGGQRLFLHTGLLLKAETPEQVMGVIAHEVGHLAGGHLARFGDQLNKSSTAMIASYVLGAAAAVGGRPDAGLAVITGGLQLSQRTLLRYSRAQESAADQAAITFLQRMNLSPRPLLEFMTLLDKQTFWRSPDSYNPYLLTHPALPERLGILQKAVATSNLPSILPIVLKKQLDERHARMRGKLTGFLVAPQVVLNDTQNTDTEKDPLIRLRKEYARAVALYRLPDQQAGDRLMQQLYQQFPGDPYLTEMQGELYYKLGKIDQALPLYAKAYSLKPEAVTIAFGYAQCLVNERSRTNNGARDALVILKKMTTREPDNGNAWMLTSQAYGKLDDKPRATLALAELAYSNRNTADLALFVRQADKLLPKTGTERLRLNDLKKALEQDPDFAYTEPPEEQGE